MESGAQRLNLKREVGLIGAVSFIAGTMIGSGIFISPQYVLSTIGSPGASLLVWACSGLIAMLGGLCYAELGTVISESGGEYIYMLRTAGRVVAFMFVFSFVAVMRPASATGIALSCAEYVVAPFFDGGTPPQVLVKCIAAVLILVLANVNCLSVRLATGIQVVSMVIKVLALLVIVLGGVAMVFQGNTDNFDVSFEGTNVGVSSIGVAFYQGLWSYDGWNTLNYLTEELKDPEVSLVPSLLFLLANHSANLNSHCLVPHGRLDLTYNKEFLQAHNKLVVCLSSLMYASHSPYLVYYRVNTSLSWILLHAAAVAMADQEPEAVKMKREIGLIGGVALVSGTMIGSGIFMSPQFVLAYVGSPGASLVIWALSGVVAMFAALSYTELGTIISESAVTFILVVKPFSITAMAISLAEYATAPFYSGCAPPQLVVKCVAAATILIVATVNVLNVRLAVRIQVVFLVAKVLTLTFIVIGGIVALTQGSAVIVENLKVENAFTGTQYSLSTLGMAFYQGLWSYAGWYNLNYVTEELKRPEVNLPRAVVIAISLVTGLYLLVNVSYLTVMTPKELMSSSAVAVTWGNKVLGSWGWIMSVAAALSAFGSLNGTFFSGGRVCFVAAREGQMPDILSMAHVHRLTPSPALIFTTVISLVVLIPGDFQSIVNFFSFTAWFFYAITLSGLLYLKIKKPELPRPYRVPIILPILVLIAAIFLVLAPIIDSPQIEYLYVTLFIFSGILIYIPFIHYKLCPGLLTKLTVFLQLFLEVAPVEKNL
ncbi:putative b(0-+)-type amino acid transporter 1-like [Scophthalmus maximus]|uniref:b(0,+)-type amino acid transporter 1 n=1 Tax=Scophthalmus maximus TaxID=52904 RepID=A0A2U9CJQ2_SCOMX|nr:putative b(0-+)-type amino acid transporter 1-like [Scophthalmus maximus]